MELEVNRSTRSGQWLGKRVSAVFQQMFKIRLPSVRGGESSNLDRKADGCTDGRTVSRISRSLHFRNTDKMISRLSSRISNAQYYGT